MTFKEAVVEMTGMMGDNFDVIFTDRNSKVHRLPDYSSFSDELIAWLISSFDKEDSVVCSEEEEAIMIDINLDSNELSYLLDSEVPFYYPEYTDDYYGNLAEGACRSFEERKEIVFSRRVCLVGG